MKRGIALLLAVVMLGALLCGCAGKDGRAAAEARDTSRDLTWDKAFRDDSLPEGSLSPDEVAFYAPQEDGSAEIVNVPWKVVLAYGTLHKTLPRTHFYEQYMPESLETLYPVLDFAMANGFSRACVPTTDFTPTDVAMGSLYLRQTYRINARGISSLNVASFDLEDGQALRYILITLNGMDRHDALHHQQAIAAAREIVAGIPEGSSDYDKALYLYKWLTDNVSYYNNGYLDYYDSDWNLLYDTLVNKDTVCAGYAEALYVMLNLAGVECVTVDGYVFMGGDWGGHIWNAAKIDGEYYQFDATWDTGEDPSHYLFFGISEKTLQSLYPRILSQWSKDYCPPCPQDLPLPGGGKRTDMPLDLAPGVAADGEYRQDYLDLRLNVDDSWKVYTREEIGEEFYGNRSFLIDIPQAFAMDTVYYDLVIERDDAEVMVGLEHAPLSLTPDTVCETPEDYMDAAKGVMDANFTADPDMELVSSDRYQTEICGHSYEVLRIVLGSGPHRMVQTLFCTQRGSVFLSIIVSYFEGDDETALLQELFGEQPVLLAPENG